MTSGILISLLLLSPTPSNDLDLSALLAGLEIQAAEAVRFTETRQSDLLIDPLEVSGTLRRDERGRLIRTIVSPAPETQILSESHVEVHKADGRHRRFGIHRAPELEVLYLALHSILSLDPSGLTRHFEVETGGNLKSWQMELHPRDSALARNVERLSVCGGNGRVEQFSLYLPDGETIRTHIHHAP